MKRSLAFLAALFILAFAWFMGNPGTKQVLANMSCTEYLAASPASITTLRGRLALWGEGGTMELLADNCATYPQKPMAIYFGWHQYLRQS